MTGTRTGFDLKIKLAVAGFVGVLLVLTIAYYTTVVRYQFHLQRVELAHKVLGSYLAVSNHTFRKLDAMGSIVARGRITDAQARFANAEALRSELDLVRQNIASEAAFAKDDLEGNEFAYLTEIERLVDQIIHASNRIQTAVRNGQLDEAQNDMDILRSDAVAGRFNELIDLALADVRLGVRTTGEAAARLGNVIKIVLPILIGTIVLVGLLGSGVALKHLTRSVSALRGAAAAFTQGNLDHRIPNLPEREFGELGDAFNEMAQELADRRALAESQKEDLEATIDKRTSELKYSNIRLETLDKSRRQFLANISHELRTPLTVIRGESEMALRGSEKTVPEYQDALQRVLEQSTHTARLVDDLLFVARAEEGEPRMEKRSVALAEVLKAVSADFGIATRAKNVAITESYSDEQVVAIGDPGRLRQVFTILVDNAVRYSEAGGTIQIDLERTNGGAEISVTDNGIGLTEEEARQAFYRFYRSDSAQNHAPGTGLGLPVAKAIVEAHGGQLSLSGRPGEGAVATVYLPIEGNLRAVS